MAKSLSVTEVLRDPNLFGGRFADKSWTNWIVFLKAIFGEKLTKKELEIYRRFTNRKTTPTDVKEVFVVVGRRGGKSLISAFSAIFLSCFRDYSSYLTGGERAVVMVLGADRKQTRICLRYIRAFFEEVPLLSNMIERQTAETIDLRNQVSIECHTASFRSTRGYSLGAVIADELAFWRSDESLNPDSEILAALRPGMISIPTSLLIGISSPYSRRGELWSNYNKYFGKEENDILIWQASTSDMNPTVSQGVIRRARKRDSVSAAAEYDAQFRRDIETFVDPEAIEVITIPGRRELAPVPGLRYWGFCDPSGGSGDSMTLAIAHQENGKAVLDCVRERRPPFSPEQVVREFVQLLKLYRVGFVTGDRYAGEWPREQFRKLGIGYKVSQPTKSDLYLDFLPLVNSEKAELLDNAKLKNQILGLERKTSRSGKDSIDHGPGGHDDLANAAAGVLVLAGRLREIQLTWGRNRDRERRIRAYGRHKRPSVFG